MPHGADKDTHAASVSCFLPQARDSSRKIKKKKVINYFFFDSERTCNTWLSCLFAEHPAIPGCRSRNGGQGLLLVQSLIWAWQLPVWQEKVLKGPVAISGVVFMIALGKVRLTWWGG